VELRQSVNSGGAGGWCTWGGGWLRTPLLLSDFRRGSLSRTVSETLSFLETVL
jgi:hypothetical protein